MSWHILSPTLRNRAVDATALGLLGALFGVTVYRAATQSIVHDEALTYNWFLASGSLHLFDMNANNHALNTLLARLALVLGGHSELTLRAPALLGALLCLSALFLLARALLRPGRWFLLGLASLALNPLLLDFLCAARGYGLATGFTLWALLLLLQALEEKGSAMPGPKPLWLLGSLALGLSLAANLAFLIVDAAVALLFVGLLTVHAARRVPRPSLARLAGRMLGWFAVPGPTLAALIWWPFLRKAEAAHFYVGTSSLRECATQLVESSLFLARTSISSVADLARPTEAMLDPWQRGLLHAVVLVLLPLAGILLAAAAAVIARRVWRVGSLLGVSRSERGALLLVGVLFTTLGLLFVTRHTAGLLYPVDRTGIYFIPLLTLAVWTCLCALIERRARGRRWVEWPALGVVCLLIAAYLANFHVAYFKTWRYDAGSKAIFAGLAARHRAEPGKTFSVGGHWLYEPSLNFYRQLNAREAGGRPWLQPILRTSRPRPSNYDLFVCNPVDFPNVDWTQYPALVRDPVSGTTLYRNPR